MYEQDIDFLELKLKFKRICLGKLFLNMLFLGLQLVIGSPKEILPHIEVENFVCLLIGKLADHLIMISLQWWNVFFLSH